MAISDAEIDAARERMRKRRDEQSWAIAARYDRRNRRIVVGMANGIEFSFSPDMVERLKGQPASVLSDIEISPSGLGLHWPQVDEDLLVAGLIQGEFGTKKWMASLMGKAGGASRSKAKAAAARANGKRGGRPRKIEAAE